eukprot:gnl/Trimastix_PCT/999.p1 GENE.gnl/Trimastix_PCT/999~~gnl/Trimastix_PCT/999.p1  ORF type:complete len:295 (-),score=100.47 gnl/Trimastix_PCT/999:34-918(-)
MPITKFALLLLGLLFLSVRCEEAPDDFLENIPDIQELPREQIDLDEPSISSFDDDFKDHDEWLKKKLAEMKKPWADDTWERDYEEQLQEHLKELRSEHQARGFSDPSSASAFGRLQRGRHRGAAADLDGPMLGDPRTTPGFPGAMGAEDIDPSLAFRAPGWQDRLARDPAHPAGVPLDFPAGDFGENSEGAPAWAENVEFPDMEQLRREADEQRDKMRREIDDMRARIQADLDDVRKQLGTEHWGATEGEWDGIGADPKLMEELQRNTRQRMQDMRDRLDREHAEHEQFFNQLM